MTEKEIKTVVVVDDDPDTRDAIFFNLSEVRDYNVVIFGRAEDALDKVRHEHVDVVLSDIVMPEISGIELLDRIHAVNSLIPVILMTGYADLNIAVAAIKKGAFDFLLKPFHPDYLQHAIKKAIQHNNYLRLKEDYKRHLENMVMQRTEELEIAKKRAEHLSNDIVKRLMTVAEFRDMETMEHVSRIGLYSEILSQELGMPEDFIKTIKLASPLHDIGKIGIADTILLKTDGLTSEEFDIVKTHTVSGEKILRGSSHAVLQMATSIALTHHEKWDGSGYPEGLKGKSIPFEGRIVCLVDQYDAIRSRRTYKPGYSHRDTVRILTEGDGRTVPGHFDPEVLRAFVKLERRFNEIFSNNSLQ